MECKVKNMLPIGPLMIEHRLIERMVVLIEREAAAIRKSGKVNEEAVFAAVDFFKSYAGRCHHGKEEEIYFRDLEKKALSAADEKMLSGLKRDHAVMRNIVGQLSSAISGFHRKPDAKLLLEVAAAMEGLAGAYRPHIIREDKQFFIPSMRYLSKEEQDAMLCEFWDFDKGLIHEKYAKVAEQLQGE